MQSASMVIGPVQPAEFLPPRAPIACAKATIPAARAPLDRGILAPTRPATMSRASAKEPGFAIFELRCACRGYLGPLDADTWCHRVFWGARLPRKRWHHPRVGFQRKRWHHSREGNASTIPARYRPRAELAPGFRSRASQAPGIDGFSASTIVRNLSVHVLAAYPDCQWALLH
jgi:hypothetical protein